MLIDEIYQSPISKHPSPISTIMQSLKNIWKKMLKIESGNEVVTDGQTDRRTHERTDGQSTQIF